MKSERGQVVLILILVMTVALAIGISVIQRSLSDISTSTKIEQSSRAFSAAEAGIEQVLSGGSLNVSFPDINSSATVIDSRSMPCVPGSANCAETAGTRQKPLEYPPLTIEDVAHVWLADYTSAINPPQDHYKQPTLDIYWGDPSADDTVPNPDIPALELTLVYYESGQYKARKWYIEDARATRDIGNNFYRFDCVTNPRPSGYRCQYKIGSNASPYTDTSPLPFTGSMLLQARFLYNRTSQPFAVQATGTCSQNCSIPPQARELISTGTAGGTQRKVRLYQEDKVVPLYFNYAIFSKGEISK